MDAVEVDSVLWRFINISNFRAMYDLNDAEGEKSQVDIRISKKDEVIDFFDFDPDPNDEEVINHSIDVVGVNGIPASDESIPLTNNKGRGGDFGEWRIPKQHRPQNKYELWKPTYGFPDADEITWNKEEDYYDEAPPVIYFVRDTNGFFYSRALPDTGEETLNNYPDKLSTAWEESREKRKYGNFGVVEFDSDMEESQ